VAFADTAQLRYELETALPARPFTIRFWDGTSVRATGGGSPTFTIYSPGALAHVLRAPGELGLGRA
jgi:cyclopropane-fatty-acyl-phospholipid synthase